LKGRPAFAQAQQVSNRGRQPELTVGYLRPIANPPHPPNQPDSTAIANALREGLLVVTQKRSPLSEDHHTMAEMTKGKHCQLVKGSGEACGAFAVTSSDFCFQHDPSSQEKATDAHRLGGLRRKREKSVGTSYRLGDLRTFDAQWRLLEIAATDALALENSPARIRLLLGTLREVRELQRLDGIRQREARREAEAAEPRPKEKSPWAS